MVADNEKKKKVNSFNWECYENRLDYDPVRLGHARICNWSFSININQRLFFMHDLKARG